MLALVDSAESFGHAVIERAPNYIAESAYRIATAFSAFYHENHVLSEEDEKVRTNRLALCAITKARLCFLIELLGMNTVDAM